MARYLQVKYPENGNLNFCYIEFFKLVLLVLLFRKNGQISSTLSEILYALKYFRPIQNICIIQFDNHKDYHVNSEFCVCYQLDCD